MKRLTLLRHAKSSWNQQDLDDFDRPLNDRGRKAAHRMGRELKRRGMKFDLVLASPAKRVRETIEGVAEKFDEFDREVRFEPSIYLADSRTLIDLVRALPDAIEAPILIGHNPGMEQVILKLAKDGDLRRRVSEGYPTAALAVMAFDVDEWASIGAGNGDLVELILPRELD